MKAYAARAQWALRGSAQDSVFVLLGVRHAGTRRVLFTLTCWVVAKS